MKMTKIESARIIAESTDNPVCRSIFCSKCFNSRKGKACKDGNLVAIEKAKAYIKRHESKSKKKDHILDTKKKVDTYEVKSTAVSYEPCVSCRNNHGLCSTKERTANVKNCVSYDPINLENSYLKKKVEEPKPIKTVGIDNSDVTLALTPQHEPTVKENLSVPQPVKFEDEVPEYVYIVYASVIRCYVVIGGFKKVIDKNLDGSIRETFTIYAVPMTEESGEWLDAKGCYRTPEEALQVAKKLWGSK